MGVCVCVNVEGSKSANISSAYFEKKKNTHHLNIWDRSSCDCGLTWHFHSLDISKEKGQWEMREFQNYIPLPHWQKFRGWKTRYLRSMKKNTFYRRKPICEDSSFYQKIKYYYCYHDNIKWMNFKLEQWIEVWRKSFVVSSQQKNYFRHME